MRASSRGRGRARAPATCGALGEIAEAGLYRLCVPASLGGGEAEPAELLGAVEALAEGDAAAGWCVAVCATAGMLGAYLAPDQARAIYGDAAGVVGGVFAPSGRAVAEGDVLEVSGRWRFCSNVDNCDWLMAGCIVYDGEAPRMLESGRPDIRLALIPREDVEVLDTWSVSGLRATGSHDIAAERVSVPAARTASLISDQPTRARAPLCLPAVRPARRVDRRGRPRHRARGTRRDRRAGRRENADAQQPQARGARGDAVGGGPR